MHSYQWVCGEHPEGRTVELGMRPRRGLGMSALVTGDTPLLRSFGDIIP